MKSVVFLLVAELDLPWSTRVLTTDASEQGIGVCVKEVEVGEVRDTAQWNEKWRYKRLDPSEWAPRRRALGEFPEITDPHTVTPADPLEYSENRFEMRKGFPEVPDHITSEQNWKTLYAGPMQREDIGILEGRGHLWALRHEAKFAENHSKRQLFLMDNFHMVFALTKCRSGSHGVLQLCRRRSALLLASGIVACLRWVPSERNPADKPSRVFMDPILYESFLSRSRAQGPHGKGSGARGSVVDTKL